MDEPIYQLTETMLINLISKVKFGRNPADVLRHLNIGGDTLHAAVDTSDNMTSTLDEKIEAVVHRVLKQKWELIDNAPEDSCASPPAGVWFVYGLDTQAYPLMITNDELTAYKAAYSYGQGMVKYWEFGKAWDEIKNA